MLHVSKSSKQRLSKYQSRYPSEGDLVKVILRTMTLGLIVIHSTPWMLYVMLLCSTSKYILTQPTQGMGLVNPPNFEPTETYKLQREPRYRHCHLPVATNSNLQLLRVSGSISAIM